MRNAVCPNPLKYILVPFRYLENWLISQYGDCAKIENAVFPSPLRTNENKRDTNGTNDSLSNSINEIKKS